MGNRRRFLKLSTLGAAVLSGSFPWTSLRAKSSNHLPANKPLVISTWEHGLAANNAAWEVLNQGGTGLDAVERGVKISEGDPDVSTVGYGGLPDREGRVTLDSCIMDSDGQCGSVAFLQHIKHPISVARKVMEETPHVMLVGDGALQFALQMGFTKEDLLTDMAKVRWKKWLKESNYEPVINVENHDTIGMLALDDQGNLAGACTTSGLAYKMGGRVGDSPIIGAGLFVDNEVGAATATGLGEAVIRTCGSHLVVELMRQGLSPQEACQQAVNRINDKHSNIKDFQVGFIAINIQGEIGAYSVQKEFNYAVYDKQGRSLKDAPSLLN